jgi:hypothetical protein
MNPIKVLFVSLRGKLVRLTDLHATRPDAVRRSSICHHKH